MIYIVEYMLVNFENMYPAVKMYSDIITLQVYISNSIREIVFLIFKDLKICISSKIHALGDASSVIV